MPGEYCGGGWLLAFNPKTNIQLKVACHSRKHRGNKLSCFVYTSPFIYRLRTLLLLLADAVKLLLFFSFKIFSLFIDHSYFRQSVKTMLIK